MGLHTSDILNSTGKVPVINEPYTPPETPDRGKATLVYHSGGRLRNKISRTPPNAFLKAEAMTSSRNNISEGRHLLLGAQHRTYSPVSGGQGAPNPTGEQGSEETKQS